MSLSTNNICVGTVFIEKTPCKSTNAYAKELMSKSEPIEGTVIITDNQTHGKGQIGNTWQSALNKNLTFSIILKPSFLKIEDQFMLSKIVSLACMESLSLYSNQKMKIKWPNDILFENKKIAGILIENTISSNKLNTSVIGVGININQEKFIHLPRAISLQNITQKQFNIETILYDLLKRIDVYYLQLRKGNFEEINTRYTQFLFGFEALRVFNQKGILFSAKLKGVNKIGQLILEKENKEIGVYNFKELTWMY